MGPNMLKNSLSWHPAWLLLTVVLLLGVAQSDAQGGRLERCNRPPQFRVNGVEPMALTEGHVTMVALLTSTCPFCISQAHRMQTMSTQADHTNVRMMIVNGGPRPAPGEEGVFEGIVSFPVYHDDDSDTIWNRVFHGNKDDIFIFNRCGEMTYRIPFPYSYLGYSYVRRALRRTGNANICPRCQQDVQDTMMGDAPGFAGFGGIARSHRSGSRKSYQSSSQPIHRGGNWARRSHRNRNRNRSRCPIDDQLCRELRRGRRRYNRFRSQYSVGLLSQMSEDQILGLFNPGQRRRMGPVA